MINEDFIRKGNILKKHQTLPYLLAVVEVEVMVIQMVNLLLVDLPEVLVVEVEQVVVLMNK